MRNLSIIYNFRFMQLILLSGGSGKRLWPLSNNARSKQFLPLLEKEDGTMGYKPAMQEAPGNVRTVKGADHEHLLENPIYCRLYESYNDAVQQINLVRGEMRTRCEGYERRIRGYRENIQTLQQEVERLREAMHAGA